MALLISLSSIKPVSTFKTHNHGFRPIYPLILSKATNPRKKQQTRCVSSHGESLHSKCKYNTSSYNRIKSLHLSSCSNQNGYNIDANGRPQSRFLDQVERSIQNVFQKHDITIPFNSRILDIDIIIDNIQPLSERESVGVAINLYNRIFSLTKNGDCRRCWLQAAHCICDSIPSLEAGYITSSGSKVPKETYYDPSNITDNQQDSAIPNIHRLFLLTHHKEIGMTVDTAKLILACFENTCRLVVGGIDSEYQSSMKELLDATQQKERRCMVLFPSEDSMTYADLKRHVELTEWKSDGPASEKESVAEVHEHNTDSKWDVIVIDGTWSQARKLYTRYIPTGEESSPLQVCLSQEAVRILDGGEDDSQNNHGVKGRQLRRHPIKWREVSTLEATRLLIRDIMNEELDEGCHEKNASTGKIVEPCYDVLARYQCTSDAAAKRQLGPKRKKVT